MSLALPDTPSLSPSPPEAAHLQTLSMAMSRSCSYMEGWLFFPDATFRVDSECSLVTLIFISLPATGSESSNIYLVMPVTFHTRV